MTTPNNAAALERLEQKWREDARYLISVEREDKADSLTYCADELAKLRATLAPEASGADWHWLRTDDWSEIVQAMPLGDDRYATGYQDAMNAVTRKLCSLPRPVINPAQPDALTSQPSGVASFEVFAREFGVNLTPYPASLPNLEGLRFKYAQANDAWKAWVASHPSADAPGVAVDEAMVSRALAAAGCNPDLPENSFQSAFTRERLRAALTAALAPKPEGGHG